MSKHDHAFVPTTRQWLAVIVGVVLLLGIGLQRLHSQLYADAHDAAEANLRAVAALKSADIERWLNDRLMFMAQPPGGGMAKNFAYLLSGKGGAEATRQLQERFEYLHATIPELKSVWLYNRAGEPLIGSRAGKPEFNQQRAQGAREVLTKQRTTFIDIHRITATDTAVALDVLAPLLDADTRVLGYAQFQIDPSMLLFPLIQSWPVPSTTAESVLERLDGDEVVYLNTLRHRALPPLSLRRPVNSPGFIVSKALHGAGDLVAGVDYRVEPVLAVVHKITGTEWLLVSKMDDSEIYQDARRTFAWLAVASLFFLAILLALARVFLVAQRARAREAHYRMLAESGSDVVWLYALASRQFTYASPSTERLTGFTPEDIQRQTMQDVMVPESYQQVSADLRQQLAAFAAGDKSAWSRRYELTLKCKDGGTVDIESVTTLVSDAHGQVTHIQGVSRDIGERKKIESLLRKLSLAVEQSPVSIVITNLEAEIEYVNEAFVRATGYSREESFGQNPRMLKSGETPPAVYEDMWQRLLQGLPWKGELHNRHKDGSQYIELVNISPVRQADGRITHYLSAQEDITEQRRIEAALADSEGKLRAIYDGINEGIFVHDADNGQILDVNASACKMYGYDREQLLSFDVSNLSANVEPYTLEHASEYIRLAREHQRQSFEWLSVDSSGHQFWTEVNLQALRIGGSERVMAVVRDIDRRKHAEDALKQAFAEAQALNRKLADAKSQLLQSEKMASIGQLAAGVAHELNNPIGFVSSNFNTLESYLHDIFAIVDAYASAETGPCATCTHLQPALELKRDKDFDFIKDDTLQLMAESKDGLARVAKIVRDLKDFARAGEAELQWAELEQGLDSTLNIVWNELKYKCTVHKEYGELPPVWCVPSQLNQVFMNLLVNAAHAIPEKGDITIRTGQQGDEVFVAISDTGTGIAPENLGRIFEPFFTTKPVGKGTGLGLSLAYSIVQKHQGRIEVHSELGQGTTFTIWLPIAAKNAESTAS